MSRQLRIGLIIFFILFLAGTVWAFVALRQPENDQPVATQPKKDPAPVSSVPVTTPSQSPADSGFVTPPPKSNSAREYIEYIYYEYEESTHSTETGSSASASASAGDGYAHAEAHAE